MATKKLKRPRDPLQLAKLIGDIATGAVQDAKDNRQRQQRSGIDGNGRIELQDQRRKISRGHTRSDHRVRQHPQVAHRFRKDVPYLIDAAG